MSLGGGTFTAQNKILPGAYHNFVSLATVNSVLSGRGVATMPLELDWGVEGEVFTVTNKDFVKNCEKIFGYPCDHEKMKSIRDLFKNINTLYAYRLNGGGTKASNEFATAKFGGVRGNDLKIVIDNDVDNPPIMIVKTVLGKTVVDEQYAGSPLDLVDNDYVTFAKEFTLNVTAGIPLSGGTNAEVNREAHQAYLDKIEAYSFNTMGVVTNDDTIKSLYTNFCMRMRDEIGAKFQVVLYNKAANYEGVINVTNKVTDEDVPEASLVYWVTGVEAGCAINKSTLNRIYDGEFTVDVAYTQYQLESAIESGKYMLHKVGKDIRVLEDINSLVTETEAKGKIFKDNQTIRVVDQLANDTAILFNNKYLGSIPNNDDGRTSLWTDLVKQREELQIIGAIENFNSDDLTVEKGENKKSVVVNESIEVVGTMTKLYVSTIVA